MPTVLARIVALLIDKKFNFEFCWDKRETHYQLHIILGNVEHFIDVEDTARLTELREELVTYWI